MTRHEECGAATVLVVAMTGVLLTVGLAVAGVTGIVVSHRAAQSAADLSALAGAQALARSTDACGTAGGIAEANGARLQSCRTLGRDVLVTVQLTAEPGLGLAFDLTARARAGPG